MPFTPFHVGPGLGLKAIAGRHFSLSVFGLSQIAIDIEPLVHILRGDPIHHGYTHTYVGATLLAVVCVLLGQPLCEAFLGRLKPDPGSALLAWLFRERTISWPAAISGAFIGTYSHVFLDSLMHYDMHPLAPFVLGNTMLHALSVMDVHSFCVVSGVIGAFIMGAEFALNRNRELRR